MFCKQCGTNMGDNAVCPNCNWQATIAATPPTFNGEMGVSFAGGAGGAMAIPAPTSSSSGFFKTKKKIWIPLLALSLSLILTLIIVLVFVAGKVSDNPREVVGNLISEGYDVEITEDENTLTSSYYYSGVQYEITVTNKFDENDYACFVFCDSRDTAQLIAEDWKMMLSEIQRVPELYGFSYEDYIVDSDGTVAYIGTKSVIRAAR